MARLDEIDDQLAKLQAERAQIIAAERKEALAEVKKVIARFNFTADELTTSQDKPKRKRRTKEEMAAARAAGQK